MRCNPWRWLWGVIPIAMLTWLAITWEREGIETDLQSRAESALSSNGYGWGRIDIEGRDILLSGVAPDDAEPYRASKAVREVKGVRIVRTRTDARSSKVAKADASDAKTKVAVEDSGRDADVSISEAKSKVKKSGKAAPYPDHDWARREEEARQARIAALADKAETVGVEDRPAEADVSVSEARVKSEKSGKPYPNYGWARGEEEARESRIAAILAQLLAAARGSGGDNEAETDGPGMTAEEAAALEKARRERLEKYALIMREQRARLAATEPEREAWGAEARTLEDARWERVLAALARMDEDDDAASAAKIELERLAEEKAAREKAEQERLAAEEAERERLAEEEAARKAEEERLAAEEAERERRAEEEAARKAEEERLAAEEAERERRAEEEAARKAEEERLAAEEAERERRAEEDAARKAEEERLAAEKAEADAEAKRLAEEKAEAEAEAAAKREAEEEAQRQAEAAEAERERAAAAERDAEQAKRKAEADHCNGLMKSAMAEGVINFATAKSDIKSNSFLTLDRLAGIVEVCPQAHITIYGHTDSQGEIENNQALSEKRADAVAEYLVGKGVDASRLKTEGFGELRPVASNDTPEGMRKNRRIEFKVTPAP